MPPPQVKPRLIGAPRIRELLWCDFPSDAQLPEFWKKRPVLVVSYRNILTGSATVIPCSTQDQGDNPWAIKLTLSIDGRESWVICDKISTFAVSRFSPAKRKIRLSEYEFNKILAKVLEWLPALPAVQEPTPN